MFQEKNKAIGIVPKYNNSLRIVPYAIQKHITMYQFDFTCKYPIKSLKDQCRLVPEEVKMQLNLQNTKNDFA